MSWLGYEFEIFEEEIFNDEPTLLKCDPSNLQYFSMEILLKIFSYLNVSDMNCVSLVCQRFFEATKYWKFANERVLSFTEGCSDNSGPLPIFVNSERVYPIVSISNVNLDYDSEDFWISNGDNIEEIYFINGLLRKEEFINVVKYTPYLKVLKIETNNYFKNWEIIKNGFERRVLLNYVNDFSLSGNNYMNRDIFEHLISMMPHITDLNLSHCFHTMPPVERNRMLDYILAYLTENAWIMKSLYLKDTITDDLFLTRLSEIMNLKLRRLSLTFNGCSKNFSYGFPCLIRSQHYLEYLDLSSSNSLNDNILTLIVKWMKNLKHLILKKNHNLTDIGVREIQKLSKLQSLEISNCDHVSDTGIMEGVILGTPKSQLDEINLSLLVKMTENVVNRLAYQYEFIRKLDLAGSSTGVTDSSLQIIMKQMRMLRYLNIDNCCKISDYGFTGVHADGKRYYSLKCLKGLKVLRSSGLYKITDAALIDSFDLLELKELHFARCSGITEIGIKSLVKNCPSIELLDLSECKHINDSAVEYITQDLSRLKTLKLNGCKNVTDKSVTTIYESCKELRSLSIKKCSISADPSTFLTNSIRSLRKVHFS